LPFWERKGGENWIGLKILRRITGYIVASLEKWNDGEKQESIVELSMM
jgi:hypothetical protein